MPATVNMRLLSWEWIGTIYCGDSVREIAISHLPAIRREGPGAVSRAAANHLVVHRLKCRCTQVTKSVSRGAPYVQIVR